MGFLENFLKDIATWQHVVGSFMGFARTRLAVMTSTSEMPHAAAARSFASCQCSFHPLAAVTCPRLRKPNYGDIYPLECSHSGMALTFVNVRTGVLSYPQTNTE